MNTKKLAVALVAILFCLIQVTPNVFVITQPPSAEDNLKAPTVKLTDFEPTVGETKRYQDENGDWFEETYVGDFIYDNP